MFFVGLDVLAEFHATVFGVVDVKPSHDGARAEDGGHAEFVRKRVDPEHSKEHHLDNHQRRVVLDWCCVVVAACALLGCADAAFDVGHMFVFATDVESGMQIGSDGSTEAFEFAITHNINDAEPALAIEPVDLFEPFDE